MKVLITGVSGGLARILAQRLLQEGLEVIGIDRRSWPDPPKGVMVYQADVRKRPAEDVFRTQRPDAVVHLATVTHLSARQEERYRINLGGTQAIFKYCDQYEVKQAVFVGRHTIYGAAADAPLYRTEAEPPLATATYPALADMVAADLFAASALWRYPKLDTSVLRLAYTLGPSMRGTLASFLGGRRYQRVPMVLGFDPLFQVMHEYDAIEAIVAALNYKLRGIFNVAGPAPIPLSTLCQETQRIAVPIPEFLFAPMLKRFVFSKLPPSAINHVKYPVVIQDQPFRSITNYQHQIDEEQLLASFRSYSR